MAQTAIDFCFIGPVVERGATLQLCLFVFLVCMRVCVCARVCVFQGGLFLSLSDCFVLGSYIVV